MTAPLTNPADFPHVFKARFDARQLDGLVAGYAGGLYGHYLVFVRPDSFGIQVAIFSTFYVILGGSRNPWGPALGAVVLTLLPEYFTVLREWRPTVFGLAIILIILLRPSGILFFRLPTSRLRARSAA